MNNRKTYTAAELNSAEKLMKILSSIPEEKRTILIMMAKAAGHTWACLFRKG